VTWTRNPCHATWHPQEESGKLRIAPYNPHWIFVGFMGVPVKMLLSIKTLCPAVSVGAGRS